MKSWVWKYCKKSTDGKSAICEICDTELQTYGSTTTLIDHLMKIHSIECPSSRKRQRTEVTRSAEDGSVISIDSPSGSGSGSSTQEDIVLDVDMDTLPTKRARPTITNSNSKSGFIKKERAEIITQAIAKLIAVNRLPYNFVSSCGFQEFMKKLEPNYNCPCGQTILRRLRIMEDEVRNKIENQLAKVSFVALDTDCWTSIAQEGYINVNAHIIDDQWKQQIMTICIEELEERHTAENLADCLQNVAVKFGIEEKIVAITNDSASNIVSAVNRLPNVEFDVTCAAHKIHSAIQNAFQKGDVSCVLAKASKIVSHFRHSVLASKSLETKQEQLNLPKLKLIQSVRTRWNTDLKMSERLVENRSAIINVLADRNITNQRQAQALEMLESEWKVLEVIIELLKPLEFATTILSGGTLSMVNPIVRAIINNHLIPAKDKYNEDNNIILIINELITQLTTRFCLDWYLESTVLVSASGKASFLDPRFKQLLSETATAKIKIRESVEREINEYSLDSGENTNETEKKGTSALDFIFMRTESSLTSSAQQYMLYLAEPEIDTNMDPFEWWKCREQKMPLIARLAKKYLSIPATSVASERVFSTTGNIVTPSRNCLATKNVTTNTFLHQNKNYL